MRGGNLNSQKASAHIVKCYKKLQKRELPKVKDMLLAVPPTKIQDNECRTDRATEKGESCISYKVHVSKKKCGKPNKIFTTEAHQKNYATKNTKLEYISK